MAIKYEWRAKKETKKNEEKNNVAPQIGMFVYTFWSHCELILCVVMRLRMSSFFSQHWKRCNPT